MKKQVFTLVLMLLCGASFAQNVQTVTFRFVPGEDMFYTPWGGNAEQLNRLYSLVDKYRTEISDGTMPVRVDSYSASAGTESDNKTLAFIRANRVKSELITRKGLVEENFVTGNHATAFVDDDGTAHKDLVVVTLCIPVREEPKAEPKPEPQPKPAPAPEPEPVVEQRPEPQPVAEPMKKLISPTALRCAQICFTTDFCFRRWVWSGA